MIQVTTNDWENPIRTSLVIWIGYVQVGHRVVEGEDRYYIFSNPHMGMGAMLSLNDSDMASLQNELIVVRRDPIAARRKAFERYGQLFK